MKNLKLEGLSFYTTVVKYQILVLLHSA